MNTQDTDAYWSRGVDDREDGLAGLRGYSPAPNLSQYRMGSQDSLPTLSRQGSGVAGGSYGLSPSALDPNSFSNQFILPRFAQANSGDAYGYSGVGVVQGGSMHDVLKPTSFGASPVNTPQAQYGYQQPTYQEQHQPHHSQPLHHQQQQPQLRHHSNSGDSSASTSSAPQVSAPAEAHSSSLYVPYGSSNPNQSGPIYAPYGSSVISVNPPSANSYKPPPLSITLPPSAPGPSEFDPSRLGLPAPPPNGMTNNFAGLYSSSGFDMLGVLARVAARPNPQLSIGAVDTSCAFLVVDAKRWDQPIVFASETFSKMTGYASEEIIGRNCRFLQSPDGQTVQGAPRKYTDSNAAWHMRTHIVQGKESQSSLINYKKDGKPFINLVTIVPICWDSDEVAYLVGFQVDLVDQPNAILDRMKDGTYVINYSLTSNAQRASNATTVSMQSIENEATAAQEEAAWHEQPMSTAEEKPTTSANGIAVAATGYNANGSGAGIAEGQPITESEALNLVSLKGVEGLQTEAEKRAFHKLLLMESDDFVHVLSLKGSFLYCSPSCARVLEYQPNELIGKTLPTLCHPSDVVPVMRLLKDTSSMSNPTVSLLYRVRRKHSGYIWLESSGKLHIEPGKGRKCVILVGRPREVLKMSWTDLRQAGGLGETEFWMNLSPKGVVLSTTAAVQNVLGFSSQDLTGSSILTLAQPEHVSAIQQALAQCAMGTASTVRYRIRSKRGYSDVVTRFYPRNIDEPDDLMQPASGPQHINIIAQTNEVNSEQRKNVGPFATLAPSYPALNNPGRSPSADSTSTGHSSSSSAFQSTFKQLPHPSTINDNVFDELESRRPTSWQFELHQLQNTNRKLREEKDHVLAMGRKRGFTGSAPRLTKRSSSETSSRASNKSNRGRGCANCGRMDSPEWRAGPTGVKTLCNACGLRWAKTQRQSSEAAASGGVGGLGALDAGSRSNSGSSGHSSRSPAFSPYPGGGGPMDTSEGPTAWMQ